ncbi:hypothetical protein GCM10007978_05150 [Shewanella hanedai]|uniref:Uncharacterized protein n=1 Tax=Shewanella hanedai TaxID=25 RepID=A0A553JTQ5_SHEHA|nr:hypothetical protein [Shewanella hanedai]TRY15834.1 hypothetical protein FN961_02290 [Shewanella hanedai]GGI70169.1 hypothetical protein GCM10007978_05150 [Shewanella hanedai]
MVIKGKQNILAKAKEIAKNSNIMDNKQMFLMLRDELSNEGVRRDAIVDCYEINKITGCITGELYDVGVTATRSNEEEQSKLNEKQRELAEQQRLDYYFSANEQQVSIHREDVVVKNGRVENMTEVNHSHFSKGATMDWDGYNSYELSRGKVCQVIKLKDCDKEFRLVLGKASKGARTYDVLDFSATVSQANKKIINLDRSTIVGLGCFNISKPITVHNNWYPSIMAAYRSLSPMISYSYVTKLISKGDCADEVFSKTTIKRQALGSLTRHAI